MGSRSRASAPGSKQTMPPPGRLWTRTREDGCTSDVSIDDQENLAQVTQQYPAQLPYVHNTLRHMLAPFVPGWAPTSQALSPQQLLALQQQQQHGAGQALMLEAQAPACAAAVAQEDALAWSDETVACSEEGLTNNTPSSSSAPTVSQPGGSTAGPSLQSVPHHHVCLQQHQQQTHPDQAATLQAQAATCSVEGGTAVTSAGNSAEDSEELEYDEDDFDPFTFISGLGPVDRYVAPGRQPLLPRQTRACKQKTLVLDLDETLVHSTLDAGYGAGADFSFPVLFNGCEHMVHVRTRPHMQVRHMQRRWLAMCSRPSASVLWIVQALPACCMRECALCALDQQVGPSAACDTCCCCLQAFLESVAEKFEVVVFTASQKVSYQQGQGVHAAVQLAGCATLCRVAGACVALLLADQPHCAVFHVCLCAWFLLPSRSHPLSSPAGVCREAAQHPGPSAHAHPAPHLPRQLCAGGGQLPQGPQRAGPRPLTLRHRGQQPTGAPAGRAWWCCPGDVCTRGPSSWAHEGPLLYWGVIQLLCWGIVQRHTHLHHKAKGVHACFSAVGAAIAALLICVTCLSVLLCCCCHLLALNHDRRLASSCPTASPLSRGTTTPPTTSCLRCCPSLTPWLTPVSPMCGQLSRCVSPAEAQGPHRCTC